MYKDIFSSATSHEYVVESKEQTLTPRILVGFAVDRFNVGMSATREQEHNVEDNTVQKVTVESLLPTQGKGHKDERECSEAVEIGMGIIDQLVNKISECAGEKAGARDNQTTDNITKIAGMCHQTPIVNSKHERK